MEENGNALSYMEKHPYLTAFLVGASATAVIAGTLSAFLYYQIDRDLKKHPLNRYKTTKEIAEVQARGRL